MKDILQILVPIIFMLLGIFMVFFGIGKLVDFMAYTSSYKSVVWEDDTQVCIKAKESKSNEIKEYCIEK